MTTPTETAPTPETSEAIELTASGTPIVTYRSTDGVGHITLARSKSLNAANRELIDGIGNSVAAANADRSVRVILLDAEGRAFCAGADLKDSNTHSADDIVEHLTPSSSGGTESVAATPKPVVVAVQGFCVGVGVELTISADIAIASDDAIFFLPQVKLGIVPGAGGLSRLVRRVGPNWTARMSLLGERITADVAKEIGLVTEVVPRDQLESRALELATTLAEMPAAATHLAKESINVAQELPLQSALLADKYRLFVLSGTDEKKASHAAFAEGRA